MGKWATTQRTSGVQNDKTDWTTAEPYDRLEPKKAVNSTDVETMVANWEAAGAVE